MGKYSGHCGEISKFHLETLAWPPRSPSSFWLQALRRAALSIEPVLAKIFTACRPVSTVQSRFYFNSFISSTITSKKACCLEIGCWDTEFLRYMVITDRETTKNTYYPGNYLPMTHLAHSIKCFCLDAFGGFTNHCAVHRYVCPFLQRQVYIISRDGQTISYVYNTGQVSASDEFPQSIYWPLTIMSWGGYSVQY